MVKNFIVGISAFALAFGAFAQDAAIAPTPPQPSPYGSQIQDLRNTVRQEIQTLRQDTREQVQNARQNLKGELQTIRQTMEQKREEVRTLMQQKRDEFKTLMEHKRIETKDKIAVKRQELKDRLKNIRDEHKKQVVEKIDQRLDQINDNRVKHFIAVLDQIERVLDRIQDRMANAEDRGWDVSSVKTVITDAETKIAAARAAVQTQAGKTYLISVTGESTLHADITKAREALFNDLKAVQEILRLARDTVHNAATTLAKVPRPEAPNQTLPAPPTTP